MTNFIDLSLLFFIFSILTSLRIGIMFISALLQNPPTKLELSGRELIFYGINISYLITYIIK